ncbi:GL14269 [Drosophila persimilis]|uniref:GL14269 n=1 Tax=Drosophila persimilis TaxID=7234 RepID=B4GTJ0_DROPE|nr:GL14269 [Drosophila persimilis]
MYRLNYPLRMRQWHHMCTSWNGKTGEWQAWLKAERIGRGFHNSLVGHKIPANGKLRSGGTSITGEVSHGLHFEMTMVQVYRVALSAGKAHRDHKHHHVHHFDHEGQGGIQYSAAPTHMARSPTRLRINLANPSNPSSDGAAAPAAGSDAAQQQQQQITFNTNFVNGQINAGSRLVAQQLLGLPAKNGIPQQSSGSRFQMLSNSANVQFIDETETHIQFKRAAAGAADEKKLKKRGLVLLDDGSVVDDGTDTDASEVYNGLADYGGQQFKQDLTLKMSLEEEISTHDREPAEEEVKAVMAIAAVAMQSPFRVPSSLRGRRFRST